MVCYLYKGNQGLFVKSHLMRSCACHVYECQDCQFTAEPFDQNNILVSRDSLLSADMTPSMRFQMLIIYQTGLTHDGVQILDRLLPRPISVRNRTTFIFKNGDRLSDFRRNWIWGALGNQTNSFFEGKTSFVLQNQKKSLPPAIKNCINHANFKARCIHVRQGA